MIVLTIQANESANKRYFAYLGTVYNKTIYNMEHDSIIARLIIRIHRILEDANAVTAADTRQNRYAMLADVLRSIETKK